MKISRKIPQRSKAILLFFLAGCSPFVNDGQPVTTPSSVILRLGETVGQTFTARDRGLNGVEVFLAPDATANGEIRLHLLANSQSTTDIAMGTLSAQAVTTPGFYRFDFAPQSNSRQQDYYLVVDLQGGGSVRVGTASGDAYLDGALYQNGNPSEAQMSFRLAYDPIELMIGLASQTLAWLRVLAIATVLFVLPGWALLVFHFPTWGSLSWGEKLGLAAGVSIAIYPLLFLWTDLIGLHLGSLYAWLPIVLAVLALLWHYRAWRPIDLRQSLDTWRQSKNVLPDLILIILISAVFGVRFWVIRSIDLPMWGDSYQHTMITQLLIDHGGLFTSWEPYADMITFTYHFGFHAVSAVFHWISAMGVPQAVLWTGQILNGLAVLALYPLAVRIGINRWAGVGAVLIAGLLSPMPMYYVNWGRYTQLAGQVVLPIAIVLAWVAMDAKPRDWRLFGLAWIVLAGLGLVHYRILIFLVLFFAACILVELIASRRIARVLAGTFWLGLGSSLLFLPWFLRIFGGRIMQVFGAQLTTAPSAVSDFMQEYNALGDLGSYMPIIIWLGFLVSIIWGLGRRDKRIAVIALWSVLVFLSANPRLLNLPGEGAINNFTVFIAAYIPISTLVGGMLGSLIKAQTMMRHESATVLLAVIFVISVIMGTSQRLGDIQIVQSELVTRADLRAMAWIRENTPQDAHFLVNSFLAYGGTVAVGSDGGWWLPLLAHRQTSLPPINYSSERGPLSNYWEWVNRITSDITTKGIDSPDMLALLKERQIRYIYIGQRQGRVNYAGPVLEPERLQASPSFKLIYRQDRVWGFQIVGTP